MDPEAGSGEGAEAPDKWVPAYTGSRVFRLNPDREGYPPSWRVQVNEGDRRLANDPTVTETVRHLSHLFVEANRRLEEVPRDDPDQQAEAVAEFYGALEVAAYQIGWPNIHPSIRRNHLAQAVAPGLPVAPPTAVEVLFNDGPTLYWVPIGEGEWCVKGAGIPTEDLKPALRFVTEATRLMDHDAFFDHGGHPEDVKLNMSVAELRATHTWQELTARDICDRRKIPCTDGDDARKIVRHRYKLGAKHWERELGANWVDELKRRRQAQEAGRPGVPARVIRRQDPRPLTPVEGYGEGELTPEEG